MFLFTLIVNECASVCSCHRNNHIKCSDTVLFPHYARLFDENLNQIVRQTGGAVMCSNSHVSLRTGGKLERVTAMMMKMIKGQMMRVSDHSCQKEQASTRLLKVCNRNSTNFKIKIALIDTHWLSDDGEPVLPKKKA